MIRSGYGMVSTYVVPLLSVCMILVYTYIHTKKARRRHAPTKHETHNKLFSCSTKTSFWSFGFWYVWFQIWRAWFIQRFSSSSEDRRWKHLLPPPVSHVPTFSFQLPFSLRPKSWAGPPSFLGAAAVYLLATYYLLSPSGGTIRTVWYWYQCLSALYISVQGRFFFFAVEPFLVSVLYSWILERFYLQAYIQAQVTHSETERYLVLVCCFCTDIRIRSLI